MKTGRTRSVIGAERWLLELIDNDDVKAMARKSGWVETNDCEGLRECCEPQDAAAYSVFRSLDEATEAAQNYLKGGNSFYGCALIDYQVFDAPCDDRGNEVRACPPSWETQRTYEVAMNGERIEVES